MRRPVAKIVLVAMLLASTRAAADPLGDLPELMPTEHVTLTSGEGILEIGLRRIVIPMNSHILQPTAWQRLDVEVHRLQEQELRLTTENNFMRDKVKNWQPGWKTLVVTGLSAIISGFVLGYKL